MLSITLLTALTLIPVVRGVYANPATSCFHLFKSQYMLFDTKSISGDRFNTDVVELSKGQIVDRRKAQVSLCHEVPVPETCNSEYTKARVLYQRPNGECVIVPGDTQLKYMLMPAQEGNRSMITLQQESRSRVLARYRFICEPHQHDLHFRATYDPDNDIFEFVSESKHGCGYNLEFYRYTTGINIFMCVMLGLSGLAFCFGGYYLYHKMFLTVVVFVDCGASIFVYFDFVDLEQFGFRKYFILVTYTVIVYATYPVFYKFRWMLFVLLVFMVSYEAVLFFYPFINQNFHFINVFYDPLLLTAILMPIIYLFTRLNKDNLVIELTAAFGAYNIVMCLIYAEVLEFDLFYDFQTRVYVGSIPVTNEYYKALLAYIVTTVAGILVQKVIIKSLVKVDEKNGLVENFQQTF